MNWIPGPVKDAAEGIKDGVDKVKDVGVDLLDEGVDKAKDVGERGVELLDRGLDKVKDLGEGGLELLDRGLDKAKGLAESGVELLSEALDKAKERATKMAICNILPRINEGDLRDFNKATGGSLWGEPSSGAPPASALLVVVEGATLECEFGSTTSALKATGAKVEVAGLRACTVADHRPGANIRPFGLCKKLHDRPCEPQTPTKWAPPADTTSLGGPKLLHDAARLICTTGGSPCISILDAGQSDLSLGEAESLLLAESIKALDLPPNQRDKALADLVHGTSPSQRVLLQALFDRLPDADTRAQALSGAHLEIHDGGSLYNLFSPNGAYARDSSHKRQTNDIGFDLPGGGTILLARDADTPGITHVQFERHGLRSHPYAHTQDYCRGGQRGPYGKSTRTDQNPIVVP